MEQVRAAAIYARISSDPTGQGLGVERQLEDCRALAIRRGWAVAAEYVDNDISAYSGARRPAYELMLADLEAGVRDAIVVYNMDRLTRRPIELEQLVTMCDRIGMTMLATVAGDFDLGNDQGLFVARMMAAVAAQESARKSARQKRSNQQRAELGLAGAGGLRAFGWERDGVTLIAAEAQLIRQVVDRFLAGESVYALANWLNEIGSLTTTGKQWRATTLRNVIINPRIAGLRAHNGEVVGKAVWDPIITEDEHKRILALIASRVRAGKRSARVSLLVGVVRCGRCGEKLSTGRKNDVRNYVCQLAAGEKNCGGLAVRADPVDALIVEAVLTRLDSPALLAQLHGSSEQDDPTAELHEALKRDQEQMEELARLWSDRVISAAEWRAARVPIEDRIKAAERQLHNTTGRPQIESLAGSGATLRAEWPTYNLSRQTAIVGAVLDSVTILPAERRGSRDYLRRIVPVWHS